MSAIDRNLLTGINELGKPEFVSVNNGSIVVSNVEGISSSGSIGSFPECIYTRVSASDINGTTYYSTDCIGKIKTIKKFNYGSVSGDYAILTTFEYSDINNPTKFSRHYDSVTTV